MVVLPTNFLFGAGLTGSPELLDELELPELALLDEELELFELEDAGMWLPPQPVKSRADSTQVVKANGVESRMEKRQYIRGQKRSALYQW